MSVPPSPCHAETRARRIAAIGREIARLEERVRLLQAFSNRVSWLRVGILLAGLGGVCVLATQGIAAAAWMGLGLTLVLFGAVVAYHRRLEHGIDSFTIWRDLRADEKARLTLHWDSLPNPTSLDPHTPRPLALDLDLTGRRSLHHLLDTTISRRGSEFLADWINMAAPDLAATRARQAVVRELAAATRFRDRFRLTYNLLEQDQMEVENLVKWLGLEFPVLRLALLFPLATALTLLNLGLLTLNLAGALPPYWAVSVVLTLLFYAAFLAPLSAMFSALVELDGVLDRFHALLSYLETYPYRGQPHLAELCAPFRDPRDRPSRQLRRVKVATAAAGLRANPFLGILVNVLLPWDFALAWLAARRRAEMAARLPIWVDRVTRLDALIALGNFAGWNHDYSFPEITVAARPILEAEGLGHPLLPPDQKVCNDFQIAGPGEIALITGSNMAGKSTFLKTVGVNLCLAFAGAPVNAARMRTVPFRLHTCIRIADSIQDGFSYFYAEVKCLKALLDELRTPSLLPLLYLIDEIFRGTNNRERLIGSRSYLRALLGHNGAGLLSTHDLELAHLADENPQVHNYHFRDRVDDGRLVFDYAIRPGPSPTTNALRIMALEGLPVEGEQI